MSGEANNETGSGDFKFVEGDIIYAVVTSVIPGKDEKKHALAEVISYIPSPGSLDDGKQYCKDNSICKIFSFQVTDESKNQEPKPLLRLLIGPLSLEIGQIVKINIDKETQCVEGSLAIDNGIKGLKPTRSLYYSDKKGRYRIETFSKVEDSPRHEFLENNDIYLTPGEINTLNNLLALKKNVILQGPPGTGKTFAAKRIARSFAEDKEDHVKFVQFHQGSTYEDFVYGYAPKENGGFEPHPGVFFEFCEKAAKDKGDDRYVLIIDEINRANISKVFGELLMLIEADHRGEKVTLPFKRKGENGKPEKEEGERIEFSVPKNLYIIGLMNTADKSLALVDYALRRRFAFFDMKPAFEFDEEGKNVRDRGEFSSKFTEKIQGGDKGALLLNVAKVNKKIENDADFGPGFCIGHSYFLDSLSPEEVKEYEIKPLLKEYLFDDKHKLEDWAIILDGKEENRHSNGFEQVSK